MATGVTTHNINHIIIRTHFYAANGGPATATAAADNYNLLQAQEFADADADADADAVQRMTYGAIISLERHPRLPIQFTGSCQISVYRF